MSRKAALLAIAIQLLALPMAVQVEAKTRTVPSADYQAWAGKFPSDQVDGLKFLKTPDVRRRITEILGLRAVAEMEGMHASSKSVLHRGWLLVSGCLPHFCLDAQWTIAIDTNSGTTWVCSAPLDSKTIIYGTTKARLVRKPRNGYEERCPEGDEVAGMFDKFVNQPER